jgi:hypothetical protein
VRTNSKIIESLRKLRQDKINEDDKHKFEDIEGNKYRKGQDGKFYYGNNKEVPKAMQGGGGGEDIKNKIVDGRKEVLAEEDKLVNDKDGFTSGRVGKRYVNWHKEVEVKHGSRGTVIRRKDLEKIYDHLKDNSNPDKIDDIKISYMMAAHVAVAKHGISTKKEMLRIIDINTGKVVFEKAGTEDEVVITDKEFDRLNSTSGIYGIIMSSVHNHSNDTALSPGDISMFNKIKDMNCVGIQGHRSKVYSFLKTNTSKIAEDDLNIVDKIFKDKFDEIEDMSEIEGVGILTSSDKDILFADFVRELNKFVEDSMGWKFSEGGNDSEYDEQKRKK